MRRKSLMAGILILLAFFSYGQNFNNENIDEYIEQYKHYAMKEQIRSGVPASITLAQGILETGAGTSELCVNANNHFGIKCKKNWTGPSYTYTDDRPDECFRVYDDALQSYIDHSDFLKNNARYSRLFNLDIKDYKKWAHGLKACGYATHPQYGHRLIKHIEKHNLHQYTMLALKGYVDSPIVEEEKNQDVLLAYSGSSDNLISQTVYQPTESNSKQIEEDKKEKENKVEYFKQTEKNGLKGFYAPKNTLLLEYALSNNIRYGRLLSMNNLEDKPLEADMFIYLEKKLKKGLYPTIEVKEGMTLSQISQETAVDLNQLRSLNQLNKNEEPAVGETLNLQTPTNRKIKIAAPSISAPSSDDISELSTTEEKTNKEPEYIYLKKEDQPEVEKNTVTPEPVQDEVIEVKEKTIVIKEPVAEIKIENEVSETNNNIETIVQKETTKIEEKKKEEPQKELTQTEKLRQLMDGIVYGEDENKEQEAVKPSSNTSPQQAPQEIEKKEPKKEQIQPQSSNSDPQNPTDKLRQHMEVVKQNKKENTKSNNTSTDITKDDPIVTLPPGQQTSNVQPEEPKTTSKYYVVKKGDTAFGIAKKFGITLQQLKTWNNLPKSMAVPLGKRLKVAP